MRSNVRGMESLWRYVVMAELARSDAIEFGFPKEDDPNHDIRAIGSYARLSMWFGMLHVALDGWKQVGLFDADVDAALSHPNCRLLQDARNVTFHFRPELMERRFEAFIDAEDVGVWASQTHHFLLDAIMEHMEFDVVPTDMEG